MAINKLLVLFFIIILVDVGGSSAALSHEQNNQHHTSTMIDRRKFPKGFVFGVGSSAYQYEGAAREDGRGMSIWDTFTEQHPEKVADRSNANVTMDFYHLYKDDIKSMKEMGLDSFRFSISWPRILPRGKVNGGINKLGVKFYNDLIDELLANGIKPFVTIFHWDVPQALEDEYGGFLSPRIVNDFYNYADVVFNEFGDRVKHWLTLNEPNDFTKFGYATGTHAPGRCSKHIGNCMAGNSAIEPYVVGHHLLLSHAATVELFKSKYHAYQKGMIGITIAADMIIPINQTLASRLAALRGIDFNFGWFLDPVVYGNYPKTMRLSLGRRLPEFTKEQSKLLKRSFDFLGLNYYTTKYASAESVSSNASNLSYTTDSHTTQTPLRNGVLIGKPTVLSWLYIYPKGIRTLLHYIKAKYNNPPVFITENGMPDHNNGSLVDDPMSLKDSLRVEFHRIHLCYLLKAIKEGVNVKGYYAWTWLDDFEWSSGYTVRFGINFVDFKDGLKRYHKNSFYWFKKFLAKN